MATKAEIQAHMERRLKQVFIEKVNGVYVKSAMAGGLTDSQWDAVATALKQRNHNRIGNFIANKVLAKINADVSAKATSILVDDVLSLAEYSEVEDLP